MSPTSGQSVSAVERARYKLRQAEVALQYLRQVPAEIAAERRRAYAHTDQDVRLDALFFACLGLAKSAYYILKDDGGGRYGDAIRSWRIKVLDIPERARFNRMMRLRDADVHHGRSDGKALPAMIPIERSSDGDAWIYQQRPSYAALGIRPTPTEHKNPDGSVASSYEGLQGTVNLYIDVAGETVSAADACARFIQQLRSLIDAIDRARIPPLSKVQRLREWLRTNLGYRE